jgi:hypothetical protein
LDAEATRAANHLMFPDKQNIDPTQRTPVRLDLNNVFHGGCTPATHLALQVRCGAGVIVIQGFVCEWSSEDPDQPLEACARADC